MGKDSRAGQESVKECLACPFSRPAQDYVPAWERSTEIEQGLASGEPCHGRGTAPRSRLSREGCNQYARDRRRAAEWSPRYRQGECTPALRQQRSQPQGSDSAARTTQRRKGK